MPGFWFLILSFTFTFSYALVSGISTDVTSLLSFKSSISRDPSNLLSNWNSTLDHCHWYGVACDGSSGKVTALNISGKAPSVLAGTLSASIGNLTELRVLSLPGNAFSGQIPLSVGLLGLLKVLELQDNNFSGNIPYQISHLQSLRLLNLSYNSLYGSIPDKLIGNGVLKVVDLSNNMLSGGIIINNSSRCEFLNHLKLSFNFLVGNIPTEIGKCRNLRTLLLDWNILEGRIPGEIGRISELIVLDVSRNSLTDRVPQELANCRKLSALILTNVVDDQSSLVDSSRLEFNAFDGGIPHEILLLPSLQIFWAPRANIGGRLPRDWTNSCSLRALNLGQNYFSGMVPESTAMCKNLTFLDLSSNNLSGHLPSQLQVSCMVYFNISRNNMTGMLPKFGRGSCGKNKVSFGQDSGHLDAEDLQIIYPNIRFWSSQIEQMLNPEIIHDFSFNKFVGSLPIFSVGGDFLADKRKPSYRLLLNNNMFNGSLHDGLVANCNKMLRFSVNMNINQLSGGIHELLPLGCQKLMEFEAAHNRIGGSVFPDFSNLTLLQRLDLTGNRLSGSLPDQLGNLKQLKWILLGGNNITGVLPSQLGQLTSVIVLDLSHNAITGSIPESLTKAINLEILLLDHNRLFGEIPSSFFLLSRLTTLDVSFNNLSGHVPHLQHQIDCKFFRGNRHLDPCLEQSSAPAGLPVPPDVRQQQHGRKLKYIVTAVVTSASVALCVLLFVVVVYFFGRRRFGRLASLRGRVVVTFPDTPMKLNYENVVRATGNFRMKNLIGTGGFGSTYKAELVPGYLVAVKRLSIGRFQGIQQFDAEIRTLGRIRHRNLVTLLGYYVGEAEMFLIYNYLSGGNLETFIHDKSGKSVGWSVTLKIASDIAQALAYLHYSCVPRIVHRDIKPSNILLDEELNAFLSDFGLARLLEVSETHATTDVAGTFGYLAPEYATTCRVSDRADVYSFGVVMLELISRKRTLDPSFSQYGNGFNIVTWAQMLMKEGRSYELFSAELWDEGPEEKLLEMLRLASICTSEMLSIRPSMKQVLEILRQLRS